MFRVDITHIFRLRLQNSQLCIYICPGLETEFDPFHISYMLLGHLLGSQYQEYTFHSSSSMQQSDDLSNKFGSHFPESRNSRKSKGIFSVDNMNYQFQPQLSQKDISCTLANLPLVEMYLVDRGCTSWPPSPSKLCQAGTSYKPHPFQT